MKRTVHPQSTTAQRSMKLASDALKLAGKAGAALAGTEGESEAEVELDSEQVSEHDQLRAEIPRQRMAYVSRRQGTGNYAILDKIDPRSVTQPYFMDAYGGGVYKIDIRGPKKLPNGKTLPSAILETIILEVDPSIPPKAPPSQRIAPTGGPLAAQSPSDLSQLAIANFITQSAQQSLATMAMVNGMIGGMMEVMKGAGASREPDPMTKMLLEVLLKDRGGKQADPIEQLNKLAEFQERMGLAPGGGGNGDVGGRGPWDVAHEYLPLFLEALRGGQPVPTLTAGQPAAGNPTAPPGPAVVIHEGSAPPVTEGDPMAVIFNLIAPQLPKILKHAAADHDPEVWAIATLDEIPESFYPTVYEALIEPGFLEAVIARFPAAAQHREWLEQFLASAISQLNPEEESTAPPAAPAAAPVSP